MSTPNICYIAYERQLSIMIKNIVILKIPTFYSLCDLGKLILNLSFLFCNLDNIVIPSM